MHRLCLLIIFFSVRLLEVRAQNGDTGPVVPSVKSNPALVATPGGAPLAHSPFKALNLDRLAANGHKESGIVDIVFTASNQSTRIASLAFSIDPALSKASDDFDTVYHFTQLRFGATKSDSTSNAASVTTIELRPDQALHCGFYIAGVPLTARYIRKVVLFTTLRLDDVPQGEDNIVLFNVPIIWK